MGVAEGPLDFTPTYTTFEFYVLNRTHSLYLAYTKTMANNLPLTDFAIDKAPCLLPYQNYTQQSDNYYPLENDKFYPRECSKTTIDGYNFDDRFTSPVGTNEFSI